MIVWAHMSKVTFILDDAERVRRLQVLDKLAAKPRTRAQAYVDKELRLIRISRRVGWRRRPE